MRYRIPWLRGKSAYPRKIMTNDSPLCNRESSGWGTSGKLLLMADLVEMSGHVQVQ